MTESSYIIELFKWNVLDQNYVKKDDSTLYLNSDTGIMTIKSQDDSKTVYLRINVKEEELTILSRKKNNLASMYYTDFTIDHEMYYSGNKFGLRFDSRSTASEKNFYDLFSKIKSKVQFTEHYPSGNKKIEGAKTDDGYNGLCIEYHDHAKSQIKYIGEFEDGLYDGEGEFISIDGNIRLICKNICSGKPNGKGKMVVGRNRVVKILEMKNFTTSSINPNYTNTIYGQIEPMYEDLMEVMKFEALSLEDRTVYLLTQIQKLRDTGKDVTKSSSIFNIF